MAELKTLAMIENIPQVSGFAEEELEKMGASMKTLIQVNVAIDEIVSNISYYAYPDNKDAGPLTVKIQKSEDGLRARLIFEDEGVPYNPLEKEDPDTTLGVEERGIGGLGIFIVKKTMDFAGYAYEAGKNILTIEKTL